MVDLSLRIPLLSLCRVDCLSIVFVIDKVTGAAIRSQSIAMFNAVIRIRCKAILGP